MFDLNGLNFFVGCLFGLVFFGLNRPLKPSQAWDIVGKDNTE